jgi:nucleotide-binding universal stress UspA family protein
MPKTIIVPLDGSEYAERALAPARMLARQSDADLVLVMGRLGGVPEPERYFKSVAARARVEHARTVVLEDAIGADAIRTVADTEPDPLVCMATRARNGLGQALFGGTTEEVIRSTRVPILLIGPSVKDAGKWSFDEMVVCLDGSPTAAAIVPIATDYARDFGLTVWLVSAIDPSDAPTEFEAAHLHRAARELKDRGVSVNWDTLHGHDAVAAIIDFVATRSSPLLAMTTHGRTGVARIVAGSVTVSVVHRAPCPVLVTRSHAVATGIHDG